MTELCENDQKQELVQNYLKPLEIYVFLKIKSRHCSVSRRCSFQNKCLAGNCGCFHTTEEIITASFFSVGLFDATIYIKTRPFEMKEGSTTERGFSDLICMVGEQL